MKCKCGCGNDIGKYSKEGYVKGHHCFGRKLSEETKKKISKKHQGKIISTEHRLKISQTIKSNPENLKKLEKAREVLKEKEKDLLFKEMHSKRTSDGMGKDARDKIRLVQLHNTNRLGIPHTEETKRIIGLKGIGREPWNKGIPPEKQPMWKGGLACGEYCEAWLDLDYKEDIKLRDNYKCQNPDCWNKTKRLSIHHINYNKKDCCPSNLITLCVSCNSRANTKRDYWKEYYKNLLENRK